MHCILEGLICGVDEAGRGPAAGPVVAASVAFLGRPEKNDLIRDSKELSPEKRLRAYEWVMANAYRVGIGISSPEEIDRVNILNASLLAMERALEDLGLATDLILIDGNRKPKAFQEAKCVVRGDKRCFIIACASIVAKVTRDRIMLEYQRVYPAYGFAKNKGYLTREHIEAIRNFGPCPIHRRTFIGVRKHL